MLRFCCLAFVYSVMSRMLHEKFGCFELVPMSSPNGKVLMCCEPLHVLQFPTIAVFAHLHDLLFAASCTWLMPDHVQYLTVQSHATRP